MSEVKTSPFKLVNFKIRESHFVLKDGAGKDLRIAINPKGLYSKHNKSFDLELDLRVESEDKNLSINVIGIASFEFKEQLDGNPSSYFMTNAPAIAFPYLRAYISSLTAQSGIEAVILPTINLSSFAKNIESTMQITE